MAASQKTMTQIPSKTSPPDVMPTDQELRSAYKLRGGRIFDALDTQIGNADALERTKKAAGSEAQRKAYHDGLRLRATRLIAIADGKSQGPTSEIPDA